VIRPSAPPAGWNGTWGPSPWAPEFRVSAAEGREILARLRAHPEARSRIEESVAIHDTLIQGVAPLHGNVVNRPGCPGRRQNPKDQVVELEMAVVLAEDHNPGGIEGSKDLGFSDGRSSTRIQNLTHGCESHGEWQFNTSSEQWVVLRIGRKQGLVRCTSARLRTRSLLLFAETVGAARY